MKIKALRTNCVTNQIAEVEVEVEVGEDDPQIVDEWKSRKRDSWLYLRGGPTGYESMRLSRLQEAIDRGGWTACVGTKNLWDRLYVPAESLKQVQRWLDETEV